MSWPAGTGGRGARKEPRGGTGPGRTGTLLVMPASAGRGVTSRPMLARRGQLAVLSFSLLIAGFFLQPMLLSK